MSVGRKPGPSTGAGGPGVTRTGPQLGEQGHMPPPQPHHSLAQSLGWVPSARCSWRSGVGLGGGGTAQLLTAAPAPAPAPAADSLPLAPGARLTAC